MGRTAARAFLADVLVVLEETGIRIAAAPQLPMAAADRLIEMRERMMSDVMVIDGRVCKLCRHCGCPMKPKGVRKKPDHWDHATGCPYSRKPKLKVSP
jgi:hypothetical protein